MKKVKVEFLSFGNSSEYSIREVEIEFVDERDLVKKCLLMEENEEEGEGVLDWYKEFDGSESWDEVIDGILELKRYDEDLERKERENGGEYDGSYYSLFEEGGFRIVEGSL